MQARKYLLLCAAALLVAASAPARASLVAQADAPLNLDSPALRIVSDEDRMNLEHVKHQIGNDYPELKSVNDVHAFLDKIKLLVQKHPKNVAFAQDDLRELHKFLSQEVVMRLIRVDTEPFVMPIPDERLALAQRALEDDELTRKLFGAPLAKLVESRRQQSMHRDAGNHKDGNFFTNFWCKISGNCANNN